jgi:uncharacterized protein YbjQ (UPF0145 family)
MGTAVRNRDRSTAATWRRRGGKPFTSTLSGQEMYTLHRAGYAPRGLVMGNCVYHVARQGVAQWFRSTGQNLEMENFTEAIYDARELAMERMQAEAAAAGGEGIVAVNLHQGSFGWGAHVIEFLALGTAVAAVGELDPHVELRFDLAPST